MASFWREDQLDEKGNKSSKESSWLGEPRCKPRSKAHCTQAFNLFEMSPNWFLGIWTLDPITSFVQPQLMRLSTSHQWYILEIGLNFNQIKLRISLAQSHLGYTTGMFSFKTKFELELRLIIRNSITYNLYNFY
jgi:hypothetical protein